MGYLPKWMKMGGERVEHWQKRRAEGLKNEGDAEEVAGRALRCAREQNALVTVCNLMEPLSYNRGIKTGCKY